MLQSKCLRIIPRNPATEEERRQDINGERRNKEIDRDKENLEKMQKYLD